MDILNLCFLKKLQPHRTQVLWGLRQGSYPLALYVWSVTKIRASVASREIRNMNARAVHLILSAINVRFPDLFLTVLTYRCTCQG